MATKKTAPRTPNSAALFERVRKMCLGLPGVTEKNSHGSPCFFTKRMFVAFDDHHHGKDHLAIWVRSTKDAQQMLVDSDPLHFFVPPYVGVSGWLGARIDLRSCDWTMIADLVTLAYESAGPTPVRAKDAKKKRTAAARRRKSSPR